MGLRSGQDQNPTRVPPPSRFWFVPFEKSHNKASHLGAKIKERSEDPMREKRVGLSSNRVGSGLRQGSGGAKGALGGVRGGGGRRVPASVDSGDLLQPPFVQ